MELMSKWYIRESMSSLTILVLLVPKKDITWRMRVNCQEFNNIIVKYQYHIPR
jgi:hypothetical protein